MDLPYIQEAMDKEPAPLTAAGLFPPDITFQKFAAYYPLSTPFEYIIQQLLKISQVHPLFFMCDPRSQLDNARLIDTVEGLRIEDRLTLMASPMYLRDEGLWDNAASFARCVAEHSNGRLLDIPELNLEVLEMPVSGSKAYLNDLEGLHKSVILYTWLSFRFGGAFTDRTLAAHVKELVEVRMMRALTEFSANKKLRNQSYYNRRLQMALHTFDEQQQNQQEELFDDQADSSIDDGDDVDAQAQDESVVDLTRDEGEEEGEIKDEQEEEGDDVPVYGDVSEREREREAQAF